MNPLGGRWRLIVRSLDLRRSGLFFFLFPLFIGLFLFFFLITNNLLFSLSEIRFLDCNKKPNFNHTTEQKLKQHEASSRHPYLRPPGDHHLCWSTGLGCLPDCVQRRIWRLLGWSRSDRGGRSWTRGSCWGRSCCC